MGGVSSPNPVKRTRRGNGRSRNGCHTCRKRHRKCDETWPHCWQCSGDRIECEGYEKKLTWKNYTVVEPHVEATSPTQNLRTSTESLEKNPKHDTNEAPEFMNMPGGESQPIFMLPDMAAFDTSDSMQMDFSISDSLFAPVGDDNLDWLLQPMMPSDDFGLSIREPSAMTREMGIFPSTRHVYQEKTGLSLQIPPQHEQAVDPVIFADLASADLDPLLSPIIVQNTQNEKWFGSGCYTSKG
ncbi:hypothetical protein LTR44_006061 [Exophiala sp. CCFEE 6388]|nr:hypothetical protein LTR44_006061 [Eurotiomycetes sp. CCFEE 6388]